MTKSELDTIISLDADREAGYTDEDVIQDGVPALFLVPTN